MLWKCVEKRVFMNLRGHPFLSPPSPLPSGFVSGLCLSPVFVGCAVVESMAVAYIMEGVVSYGVAAIVVVDTRRQDIAGTIFDDADI